MVLMSEFVLDATQGQILYNFMYGHFIYKPHVYISFSLVFCLVIKSHPITNTTVILNSHDGRVGMLVQNTRPRNLSNAGQQMDVTIRDNHC